MAFKDLHGQLFRKALYGDFCCRPDGYGAVDGKYLLTLGREDELEGVDEEMERLTALVCWKRKELICHLQNVEEACMFVAKRVCHGG